jgi:hypothetical protein
METPGAQLPRGGGGRGRAAAPHTPHTPPRAQLQLRWTAELPLRGFFAGALQLLLPPLPPPPPPPPLLSRLGLVRRLDPRLFVIRELDTAVPAITKARRGLLLPLAAAVASQYFLARTDVTYVHLSQNRRQKGRNGRRTACRALPVSALRPAALRSSADPPRCGAGSLGLAAAPLEWAGRRGSSNPAASPARRSSLLMRRARDA